MSSICHKLTGNVNKQKRRRNDFEDNFAKRILCNFSLQLMTRKELSILHNSVGHFLVHLNGKNTTMLTNLK